MWPVLCIQWAVYKDGRYFFGPLRTGGKFFTSFWTGDEFLMIFRTGDDFYGKTGRGTNFSPKTEWPTNFNCTGDKKLRTGNKKISPVLIYGPFYRMASEKSPPYFFRWPYGIVYKVTRF